MVLSLFGQFFKLLFARQNFNGAFGVHAFGQLGDKVASTHTGPAGTGPFFWLTHAYSLLSNRV